MSRLILALLLAGAALHLAPAAAAPNTKPVDKVCGNTVAACEASIVKALGESKDFNFTAAGPLPPKIAEAFVRGITTNYQAMSCVDKAARASLAPEQLAKVVRSGKVDLYDPAATQVDFMLLSGRTLIARKSLLEKIGDAKKLPFPGDPIVIRTNPVIGEDEPLYQYGCGYETLGSLK